MKISGYTLLTLTALLIAPLFVGVRAQTTVQSNRGGDMAREAPAQLNSAGYMQRNSNQRAENNVRNYWRNNPDAIDVYDMANPNSPRRLTDMARYPSTKDQTEATDSNPQTRAYYYNNTFDAPRLDAYSRGATRTYKGSDYGDYSSVQQTPLTRTRNIEAGNDDESPLYRLEVYSNPTESRLYINFKLPANTQNAELLIHDQEGRVMQSVLVQGDGELAFDLSSLENGLYYVRVLSPGTRLVEQVIVR